MLPSREELMTMPITILEHQNIESQEEEILVQQILDIRRANMPVQREIYRNDIIAQNIQTPEEEAEAQKVIDQRVEEARFKPSLQVESPIDEPEEDESEEVEEPQLATKFCEFCDSKGVRHKLNCTRPNA